ncbi:MAG: N-acetyltransferase family protein [Planctomycetota bacterium]
MTFRIRELKPTSPSELDTVTRWAMATPLESIPELEGSAALALAQWPNFTFGRMRAMFAESLPKPSHRFLVAEGPDGQLVGHSMIFHKVDDDGRPYGYFFTRYVLPAHRRLGAASALMAEALAWFGHLDLAYLQAHTHATNVALQRLYARHGFSIVGGQAEPWPTVELRRPAGT